MILFASPLGIAGDISDCVQTSLSGTVDLTRRSLSGNWYRGVWLRHINEGGGHQTYYVVLALLKSSMRGV